MQLREVKLHRPIASGSPRNVHGRKRRCFEIRFNCEFVVARFCRCRSGLDALPIVYSDVMSYAAPRRNEPIPLWIPISRAGHEPPERTTSAAEEEEEEVDSSRGPLRVPRPRPPRASPRPTPARLRRRSPFVFVRVKLPPRRPPCSPPPHAALAPPRCCSSAMRVSAAEHECESN